MTKRIINRGTFVIELEACPSSSAGALYQECREKIMSSLPQNFDNAISIEVPAVLLVFKNINLYL